MPSVVSRLRRREIQRTPSGFMFNGHEFPFDQFPQTSMQGSKAEASMADFGAAVRTIHSRSGVVSAAVVARSLIMSQIVFKFRPLRDEGRLFGTAALSALERPGDDLTRETLLSRVEQDVAYHGNFYARQLADGRVRRLRPDWMTILIGSDERPDDPGVAADGEVIGYVYKPGGPTSSARSQLLAPMEVAHWAPEPHPTSSFIGEAWVTSVYREIGADQQATDHVSKYFENAATANMVATAPPGVVTPTQFTEWVDAFDGAHRGAVNAWRTIYAQSGTDIKVVGSQLGQIGMAELQGGFETRVSSRSRVPATVLLIREGLGGSALNAGNYQQTRRLWADSWFSPYAQAFCSSMARIVDVPDDAMLTFDPSRVLLLQEDQKDAADIRQSDANTIRSLVDAGYDPDAVIDYVRGNGDLAKLTGRHSGLYSVQLQEPGAQAAQATKAVERSERLELEMVRAATVTPPALPNIHVDARTTVERSDYRIDPVVHVTLPESEPPTVHVTNVVEPAALPAGPPAKVRKTIEHTADGRIAAIVEEAIP